MPAKTAKRHRDKRKSKRIEEAVQYAVAHQYRVEILILLNQAAYTAGELAELTGISLSTLSNHIKRLLDNGSIEVAKIEERRGTNIYWYRAVETPYCSQEEAETLTEMERQHIAGATVMSGMAEVLAALWQGNLADPRTILYWDWYQVDGQGRADLEAETVRYLERAREIQCESANRIVKSKEKAFSVLVSLFTFMRARKAPPASLTEL